MWSTTSFLLHFEKYYHYMTIKLLIFSVQDWFTMCANLISGVSGEAVQWVTPLGLPVMQPYMRLGQIPSLKSAKYRMYE